MQNYQFETKIGFRSYKFEAVNDHSAIAYAEKTAGDTLLVLYIEDPLAGKSGLRIVADYRKGLMAW